MEALASKKAALGESSKTEDLDVSEEVSGGRQVVNKKEGFVVRNTFIDQIPGTPSSPYHTERQVHSCPGTSLLDYATPHDENHKNGLGAKVLAAVPSSPGSDCDSNKSGLDGSRDQKPWGPDLVKSLVNAAAAAVEMHTPSLPGASRRSSPLMAKASPMVRPADPVSAAVADAVAAADAEASPEERPQKPLDICGTPSPWQNHSDPRPIQERPEFSCATPSPWQGSAVVNPEIAAKLLAMGQQKGSDGSVQDPVAMIVASAAAAANREPPIPPPAQAPPPQYCKAQISPLMSAPVRLPRIESEIGIIDEGDQSALHSASSDPEIALDAQAMAESFAALVTPEQLAEGAQWWQPMKETLTTEEEVGILDFIQRWGLDKNCEKVVRNLPIHVRHEVLANFLASPDTRNVSAKFMSWLSSRMRNFDEIQSALVTTSEERWAFYERWRLDQKCRQLVEEQAPSVQRELISNFNPPPGTKNVAGRMTAFLNMILNKTRFRNPNNGTKSPTRQQDGGKGGRGPQEMAGDQVLSDKVGEFVTRWGLDSGARSALLTLTPEAQQAAMDGFSPSLSTECTSRRFIAYLRSAKPHLNRKGKSGGKGRQNQKFHAEPPLAPGMMMLQQQQQQRVPVLATGPLLTTVPQ